MKNDILASAARLSDDALFARIPVLAGKEREACVELLAHLAELETRKSLYAAESYGSLFAYCTQALGLSGDAACSRIDAARACRRFPVIFDLLAVGSVSLTAVKMLGKHLTAENHEAVLAEARGRTVRELDRLVARLAPQPYTRPSVRKLPAPALAVAGPAPSDAAPAADLALFIGSTESPATDEPGNAIPPAAARPSPRPVVKATAPERYRVQFTVGQETHDKLRRLQDLLRREIPDGDPAAIVDRALSLLLEKVEKAKFSATSKPRRATRFKTGGKAAQRTNPSRDVPAAVQRAVWARDGGQCAFVAPNGRRCTERTFLEFHHITPHAAPYCGPATVGNISLRCRLRNVYEAELVFGPYGASIIREAGCRYATRRHDRAAMT